LTSKGGAVGLADRAVAGDRPPFFTTRTTREYDGSLRYLRFPARAGPFCPSRFGRPSRRCSGTWRTSRSRPWAARTRPTPMWCTMRVRPHTREDDDEGDEDDDEDDDDDDVPLSRMTRLDIDPTLPRPYAAGRP
jgi:hypothetical protein